MRGTLFQPGEVVAERYRVSRLLGEGGMGAVYLAHHELLQQDVALKVLTIATDDTIKERFLREARSAAKLRSRYVVRVMDVGALPTGELFIVMERLNGHDLEQTLASNGALRVQAAVDVVLEALDALSEAHAAGIVHRDLKPANLFIAEEDGQQVVKVLDFGISKSSKDENVSLTSTSSVFGSPLYMSPEQARSAKTVDHRSDIWSMGVVLYEILVGESPFLAESFGAVFGRIYEEEPALLSSRRADVPEGLARVVQRCLAKRAENRFQDCGELAQALAPFSSGTKTACVQRAMSFHRASGPQMPASGPGMTMPLVPPSRASDPDLSARSLPGGQTQNTWGPSDRTAPTPGRSPVVWVLAGMMATAAVIGIVLVAIVTLRKPPEVATTIPSAAPLPSAAIAPSATVAATASVAPSATETPSATVVASTRPVVPVVPVANPGGGPKPPKPKLTDTSNTRD